ncbi:hypothetical protein [Mycobacterium sp. NPDC050441]|uniref:hypothetical protein n=1 Tax=Mycobacterium sp. NPDC050441 TaxID=3155403 RepID=UPI0033C6FECA
MAAKSNSAADEIIAAIKAGKFGQRELPHRVAVPATTWPGAEQAIFAAIDPETFTQLKKDRQAHLATLEAQAQRVHNEAVNVAAERQAALVAAADARRRDIGGLAIGQSEFLQTPFFIWGDPDYRIESVAQPGNSFAKFKYHRFQNGTDWVSFWFMWTNDDTESAAIDISGELLVNGSMAVRANGGNLDLITTSATLQTMLQPLQWWAQPQTQPTPAPASQSNLIKQLVATAHWYSRDSLLATDVFGTTSVSWNAFIVPAHSTAVFKMSFEFSHGIDDGTADVDFETGAFAVTCPGILVQRNRFRPLHE